MVVGFLPLGCGLAEDLHAELVERVVIRTAKAQGEPCVAVGNAALDTLRHSPRWDSTLVVLVADHGYPYPATVQTWQPQRYRIPVIFTGGAIREPQRVEQVCSQIDIIPTLLAQMGIDHSVYTFGKNALDSTATPFAFYSFNDGFGLIIATDTVVIDAKADRLLTGQPSSTERHARAFIQRVMETIIGL